MSKESEKLNQKQKAFCEYYANDDYDDTFGNATKAAIKAGYSKKTAYSIGSRLLSYVEIKAYIMLIRKKREEEFYYSKSMSFAKLEKAQLLALSKVKKIFNKETGEIELISVPDIQSFLKAEELKGKLQGLYVDKSETRTDFNVNCMGSVKIGTNELALKLGKEPEKEDE